MTIALHIDDNGAGPPVGRIHEFKHTYLVDVVLEPAIPVDCPAAFQALEGLLVVLDVPLISSMLLQLLDP